MIPASAELRRGHTYHLVFKAGAQERAVSATLVESFSGVHRFRDDAHARSVILHASQIVEAREARR